MSQTVLETIQHFCENDLHPFLKEHQYKHTYPTSLIKKMGEIGLFGINIPAEFGGSLFKAPLNLPINRHLSRYCLSIPALYGIHLRASQYWVGLASETQKQQHLKDIAQGNTILTHAYHEKSIREPKQFNTLLKKQSDKWVLSGTKEWVINAQNCDMFIVIAKRESNKQGQSICSALAIPRSTPGIEIKEHHRQGLKEVSLASVTFNNIPITEENIIGGSRCCAYNIATQYQAMPLLNFSARAAGLAESITNLTHNYTRIEKREEKIKGIIYYKWSEIQMLKEAIIARFEHGLEQHKQGKLSKPEAYRSKVFCSKMLCTLATKASSLCGGTAYASDNFLLTQQLQDASSLTYIDTPNDILLSLSGEEELVVE